MACSLAASRSLRPVVTSGGRFFNVKHKGPRTPEIRDIFKKAICPRLSSTRNLARLLNLMDNRIGVTPATCPRWDVIEDTKALYIIRDMSGLPNKDYVDTSTRNDHTFGCIRVRRSPTLIWCRVGRGGLGPSILYPNYLITIYLPSTIYRPFFVWNTTYDDPSLWDVKDEVLKINIPKNKGKSTPNITIRATFTGLHLSKD